MGYRLRIYIYMEKPQAFVVWNYLLFIFNKISLLFHLLNVFWSWLQYLLSAVREHLSFWWVCQCYSSLVSCVGSRQLQFNFHLFFVFCLFIRPFVVVIFFSLSFYIYLCLGVLCFFCFLYVVIQSIQYSLVFLLFLNLTCKCQFHSSPSNISIHVISAGSSWDTCHLCNRRFRELTRSKDTPFIKGCLDHMRRY